MAVIGTRNPENLHRPGGAFGPPDETTYAAGLAPIAAIADVVERLGGTRHTALPSRPDSRGLRVGFLSRLPLTVPADIDAADVPPASVGDEPAAAHAAVRTSVHVPVLARLSH
ncbi:hypothetical protein ACFXJ5_21580 [Streptomyces sp. NPDC059373]